MPVLSPQSYGQNPNAVNADLGASTDITTPVPQHGHRLRDRQPGYIGRVGYPSHGILPTPDPTVASCISDEDVARTLIALGDASNYSHGRTSTSTVDETFSGVADAASSTGATSDSEEYSTPEGGQPKQRKYLQEDDEFDMEDPNQDQNDFEGQPKTKKIKTKMHDGPTNGYRSKSTSALKNGKPPKPRLANVPKVSKPAAQPGLMKAPSLPTSTDQARKLSGSSLNFQHQLAADEEDLSSKPRCQRCRKSKKGCDRQRPCQRCKDAGIGIDGCISEDEGNGRKGRYGRHMGVPVAKRGDDDVTVSDDEAPMLHAAIFGETTAVTFGGSPDKNKKEKEMMTVSTKYGLWG